MTDAWNAVITEVEPAPARRGRCTASGCSSRTSSTPRGSARPTARRSTPTTCPSGPRPRSQRLVDAGAVIVGKANLHEFAWGVTSQNPWYGTVQQSARIRAARRAARRAATPPRSPPGSATSGSAPTRAARSGCPPRAAARRAEVAVGPHPDRRRLSALPDFDTVGPMATTVADVALDVVGAHRRAGAGAAARRADGRPADAAAVGRRDARPRRTAPRSSTSSGSRRSAHASSRRRSLSRPTTRGRSSSTRRRSRTAQRFPARADEYGDNVREKLEHAQRSIPTMSSARATRCGAGGVPARGRPLRRADARHRDPAGGLRRARGAHSADGVPAPVQRARLGRRSRSATSSSSRRATRSCSPPGSRGSGG